MPRARRIDDWRGGYGYQSVTRAAALRAAIAGQAGDMVAALARALYKVSITGPATTPPGALGFLGGGGDRAHRETVERIRRLVALSESGEFPEEPRGTA